MYSLIIPFFITLFTKIIESVLFQIAVEYCLKLASRIPGFKEKAKKRLATRHPFHKTEHKV